MMDARQVRLSEALRERVREQRTLEVEVVRRALRWTAIRDGERSLEERQLEAACQRLAKLRKVRS
jgi:hypothetical protein